MARSIVNVGNPHSDYLKGENINCDANVANFFANSRIDQQIKDFFTENPKRLESFIKDSHYVSKDQIDRAGLTKTLFSNEARLYFYKKEIDAEIASKVELVKSGESVAPVEIVAPVEAPISKDTLNKFVNVSTGTEGSTGVVNNDALAPKKVVRKK